MNKHVKRGLGFGITSGVITTLGVIIGLYASVGSRLAVIGGILSVALADSFSDALGMHISEESGSKATSAEVWKATFSTLFSKLFFSGIFLASFFILDLKEAVVFSVILGVAILGFFNYKIAKEKKENPARVILEHLTIAIIVIAVTYLVGHLISSID